MSRPNLATRAALAWKVFNAGFPWSQWGRHDLKANPLAWPDFRLGQPHWKLINTEAFSHYGFNMNSLIYTAIMFKARAITAAPLRAYTGDPDEPKPAKPSHQLARLLKRPNPNMSGAEYDQINTVYLNIAGEYFVFLDRPRRGAFPTAMRPLRPDRTFIVPGTGGDLRGYLYVPEGRSARDGIPILPDDMIHVKLPNPTDPLEGMGYGLSPLAPGAQSADIDADITKFLKVFFERGANTGVVLKYDMPLDDTQVGEIRRRWMERYGGAQNWGDVAVLDRTGNVEKIGYTMQEMGFDSLDERNESRILGPFGVPAILLNTRFGLQRSTMANYAEARTHFWEDTFIPELALSTEEYSYYLTDEGGAFPLRDLSGVPALRKDITKLLEAAKIAWGMGTPAAAAYKIVGLEVEPFPGSDIAYIPISITPVLTDDNPVPDAMLPPPMPDPNIVPPTGGNQSGDAPNDQEDQEGSARATSESRSGTAPKPAKTRWGNGRPPLLLPPPHPPGARHPKAAARVQPRG